MSRSLVFFGGFVAAAGLAAAAWFLRAVPERAGLERRVSDAEETARRARRESADALHWAETERDRTRPLEDRIKELERLLSTTRPDTGEPPAKGPRPEESPPDQWDRNRLNQEIENLARAPQLAAKHQRYPLVLKALEARGDEGLQLLLDILHSGLDSSFIGTAASLAEGLGDERAVVPLIERGAKETDANARRLILRALANLPGEAQTPVLESAWAMTAETDRMLRALALQGLALRGHPVAIEVADGKAGVSPTMRVRAIESLRAFAQARDWKEASLVPLFGRVLRSADGPAQRKLALIAIEGYWTKDSLPDLNAFADDTASPPELALRARKLIAALEGGTARPANAGLPERGLAPESDE